jgi:hypothetical protein|tara:strand:- start:5459 stop:5701 length:243 start_codon:yes stop_codon:yes gene_type:complete
MINNPAKDTYMKFDLAADMMTRDNKSTSSKKSIGKGLLKRMSGNRNKVDEVTDKEPIDIAMSYFLAIRQERNKLQSKQGS